MSHPSYPPYSSSNPNPFDGGSPDPSHIQSSRQHLPGPSHSPQPGYTYDPSPSTTYGYTAPLGRHRSTSESSLAPIVPNVHMGHEVESGHLEVPGGGERLERRKSIAASIKSWRGKKGDGEELPPGWTKEDEEAEREFLKQGMFDWQSMKSWRFWIRKEWWYWYVAAVILAVLVALMALFHDDIVNWLEPVANWMKDLPAGWTIPVAIIFILSFPPLFGQEIVAILCGLVWGLWIGFAIVAVGTFLGEVGNFYAFKYLCRGRAAKYERDNLNYAIMAHVVRDGGFFFIFAVRMSAIPGHFSTAVFATCGMGIIIFSIACILTLPKQLIVVYLGVLFKEQEKSTKSKIISWVVLIGGGLITIWAMWYSYRRMNAVKLTVWRRQRAALAAKGISVDPVTGARRRSTLEDLNVKPAKDEEEVLMKETERPGSYRNPYDIRYQSADDMSVYHVDPFKPTANRQNSNSSARANADANADRDITDFTRRPSTNDPQLFPEARPAYPPQAPDLRRNQTNASKYSSTHGDEPVHQAHFPVPMPSGARGMAIDPYSPNPILNGGVYDGMGMGVVGGGYGGQSGYGGQGGYVGHGGYGPQHADMERRPSAPGYQGYQGTGYPDSLMPAQAR